MLFLKLTCFQFQAIPIDLSLKNARLELFFAPAPCSPKHTHTFALFHQYYIIILLEEHKILCYLNKFFKMFRYIMYSVSFIILKKFRPEFSNIFQPGLLALYTWNTTLVLRFPFTIYSQVFIYLLYHQVVNSKLICNLTS